MSFQTSNIVFPIAYNTGIKIPSKTKPNIKKRTQVKIPISHPLSSGRKPRQRRNKPDRTNIPHSTRRRSSLRVNHIPDNLLRNVRTNRFQNVYSNQLSDSLSTHFRSGSQPLHHPPRQKNTPSYHRRAA